MATTAAIMMEISNTDTIGNISATNFDLFTQKFMKDNTQYDIN